MASSTLISRLSSPQPSSTYALPFWLSPSVRENRSLALCVLDFQTSRTTVRRVDRIVRHLLRVSETVSGTSPTTTGTKVSRVKGKPCRRPGKTRFPGNPARLRTRNPEREPASPFAKRAVRTPLRSCDLPAYTLLRPLRPLRPLRRFVKGLHVYLHICISTYMY